MLIKIQDFFLAMFMIMVPVLALMTGLYALEGIKLALNIKEIHNESITYDPYRDESLRRDYIRLREKVRRVYQGTQ